MEMDAAAVDDSWLPRWTPSSLGKHFFSSSTTRSLSREITKFSEVVDIEIANFVVVEDGTLPTDPNYRAILEKARIRKLPILKVSDVEFAERYIRICDQPHRGLTLSPVINVQEGDDTLIFDESAIKYRMEDGEAEEVLDHEILLRDPIVRSFVETPEDEQKSLISVLDVNPLRIKKTRWKVHDVRKNYLSEAWFFTDVRTCIYAWDPDAFNDEYGTSCDTVTPVEAVRAALFVFFIANKKSVLSRMSMSVQPKALSTTTFDKLRMGYAFTHRGKPVHKQAFMINEQDLPLLNPVDKQLSYDIQISDWTKNFIDNHLEQASAIACFPQLSVHLIHDNPGSSKKEDIRELVNYYYSIRDIVKATVSFKKENLVAVPEFTNAVRKALLIEDDTVKWSELRKVFDEFGYLWPTSIEIGGKVMWVTEYTENANSSGPDFSNEVHENIRKAMAIFDNPDSDMDVEQKIKRTIIGGDENSQSFQTWKSSVNSITTTWVVVSRASVVPIWRMLDKDLQDQVNELVVDISGQYRVAFDRPYQFRNVKTKNYLSWKDLYYAQNGEAGKMIATAPVMSADGNMDTKWKFVRVKEGTDVYLQYGDSVYVQPSISDTERLCLDMSYRSPVTECEGLPCLRETKSSALDCGTDKWIVEYSRDISQDASGNNVNNTDMNTYVQISDVFRLSFGDLYLASDDHLMENVRVRRKRGGTSHRLRKILIGLAHKFREVFATKKEDLVKTADKKADWSIVSS
ncbi:hypothetical protein BC937DRAFT_92752 [Endogone sp. FLAS-F59071]|nr:hypothetical protein BC937DRAFT_92752 [Endogone sp. FLAS-F59071]|eukprot:RUS21417.1 hypothetical protein BC937DRAFT_92752 [Endogone sp. FLAS-F59071]